MSNGLTERFLNSERPIDLKVRELCRLIELIERDEPKPIVKKDNEYQGTAWTKYLCPVCGQDIGEYGAKNNNFCYKCGQRFDKENYSL